MSEVRLQLKKAIPIIVVTWILSLTTTLAFVYIAIPNIFPQTWHEVAEFSGIFKELDNDNTDSFYISCDHWRLHWSVTTDEPPPEDVEFRLFLMGASDADPAMRKAWLTLEDFKGSTAQGWAEWFSHKDGTEYITGSGEFSVWLVGCSLEWEIIVEAYY